MSQANKSFSNSYNEKNTNSEISREDIEIGEVLSVENGELEKRFSLWSLIGMVYSSFATPLALGTFLSLVIGVGGSPFFFYSYLLTSVFNFLITLSVCEISSAYPHSSAQVFWAVNVVPARFARFLSYISGIFSCACYLFGSIADGFFFAYLLVALIEVFKPEYIPQTWHIYLISIACWTWSFLLNAFAIQSIPYLSNFLNYVINLGSLFIFISLLARVHPKQSANFVFKDIENETGWTSNGVVFFLSILPGCSSVALFDGACHMTDEIPQPERNIPLVIFYSYTAAIILGVIAIIVYMFCIVDVEALLVPVGGEPIIQLFYDSYRSLALTTIASIIFLLLFWGATATFYTSTSRLIMSFARLKGLPFPRFFGSVNKRFKVPINALLLNYVACIAIGAIAFGSASALNAIMGSFVVCMYISYLGPFIGLILKKERFENRKIFFSLGNFGLPINIICIFWFIFATVWLNMPSYRPVMSSDMNYTCVVIGCVLLVGIVNWFAYSRKHFERVDKMSNLHSSISQK
jgi:amino acid transporter